MLIISLVDSHRRTGRLTDNLQQLNRQLELQARFDALTGLANRHQMDLRMQDCLRSALLSNRPFAVIFLNVDHFKRINDTWGTASVMSFNCRCAAHHRPAHARNDAGQAGRRRLYPAGA